MTRIERLKREALNSARFRGHDMSRFIYTSAEEAYAFCCDCERRVVINCHPAPNGIFARGEALAVHCTKE